MRNLMIIIMLCLILVPSVVLGDDYQHKMDLSFGTSPRFLGSKQLGNINHWGLSLYVDDPQTHQQLFGFELKNYDNNLDQSSGLIVPEHEFALGLNYPLGKPFGLKLATNYESFLGDDPFFSYGLYPYYKWASGGLELGREYDSEGSFSYLMSNLKTGEHQIFSAISLEKFEERQGAIMEQEQYSRFGGALRYALTKRWHLIGGANYNPVLERMSWLGGFSHSINFRDSGLNPGLIAIHRIKPGSRYSLAIFTLNGRALNQSVNRVIHEAFFRGSFKRSRIIGGRYMGDPGLGSAHEQVDFGTLMIAFSSLSVDIGDDSELMHNDVTGYLSYPGILGPLNRPYVGFTWAEFSDLVYDFRAHQLNDPRQQYWQFKLGTKIKINQHDVRINLTFDDNGGVNLKSSLWF